MATYAYVIIDAADGKFRECRGLIESANVREAVVTLVGSGFYIREIRLANEADLRLEAFKKFRKRLVREPEINIDQDEITIKSHKKQRFAPTLVLIVLVIVLLILYVFLGGPHA